MEAKVKVKCIGCGATKEVGPQSDVVMCDKCMNPMVAVSATAK